MWHGYRAKNSYKTSCYQKKQFDESRSNEDEERQSVEESCPDHYFLVMIDMAIASLNSRFEQLTKFEKVFGFLFNSINLKSLDDDDLWKYCTKFAETFTHGSSSNVELNDFFSELKVLQVTLPDGSMSAPKIL
jgi:hypothetical protein